MLCLLRASKNLRLIYLLLAVLTAREERLAPDVCKFDSIAVSFCFAGASPLIDRGDRGGAEEVQGRLLSVSREFLQTSSLRDPSQTEPDGATDLGAYFLPERLIWNQVRHPCNEIGIPIASRINKLKAFWVRKLHLKFNLMHRSSIQKLLENDLAPCCFCFTYKAQLFPECRFCRLNMAHDHSKMPTGSARPTGGEHSGMLPNHRGRSLDVRAPSDMAISCGHDHVHPAIGEGSAGIASDRATSANVAAAPEC